jgi:putative tryptophan/tyrosine transport system substrate-binding protein
MRRRDFVGFAASAAAAMPWRAFAQQDGRKPIVGLITAFTDSEMQPIADAFRQRMRELGWTDGRNVRLDVLTSNGDYDKLAADAGRLVAARADIIVAMGTPSVTATRKHTLTTPVVFTQVADPVGQHLIASLARPGGNLTGLTNFEFSFGGKWIELVQQLDPRVSHLTVIANPANNNTTEFARSIRAAGVSVKVGVEIAWVHNAAEIREAIERCSGQSAGGLVIFPDSLAVVNRTLIIELAAQFRLPAVYPFRIFVQSGGLVSYGTDFKAIYRQAAEYTDKILKGAKPADMPVQAPTKFELVLNVRTAKALGLTIPVPLQIAADELMD